MKPTIKANIISKPVKKIEKNQNYALNICFFFSKFDNDFMTKFFFDIHLK